MVQKGVEEEEEEEWIRQLGIAMLWTEKEEPLIRLFARLHLELF